jgi:hypothetical protein
MKSKLKLPKRKIFIELSLEYPEYFSTSRGSPVVLEEWNNTGFLLFIDRHRITIKYRTLSDMLRALGTLISQSAIDIPKRMNVRKTPPLEFRGLMIDVSRNGVIKVDYLKKIVRILSLMGLNHLTLYTEDTYEVSGHPLIGYQRGAYSKNELKDISQYAKCFGIEMFPCIQTLGHMEQILKFDAYLNVKDTSSVLSVKAKETYKLIETLIKNASQPYESRLIHLGMDETWDLGRGECFEINKKIDPRMLYLNHLIKVNNICKKFGLRPIIWGDIVLGLSGTTSMNRQQKEMLPSNIIMNYWNYYREDHKTYEKTILQYRKMGFEPMVSSGIWNWGRLWGLYPKVEKTTVPFMEVSKKMGIKRAMMTMWGDDGQETPFASNFPGLTLYLEHCYENSVDTENVKKRVKTLCRDDWEGFVLPSEMDLYNKKYSSSSPNMAKCFLYDDPIMGLYSSHTGKDKLNPHFKNIKTLLQPVTRKASQQNKDLFKYAYALADCLSVKADLRNSAYSAYKEGNRTRLKKVLETIPTVISKVDTLWKAHKQVWLEEKKAFGMEVIDLRYGGCISRLNTMRERLSQYLKGKIASVEEFEETPRNIYGKFSNIRLSYRDISNISLTRW